MKLLSCFCWGPVRHCIVIAGSSKMLANEEATGEGRPPIQWIRRFSLGKHTNLQGFFMWNFRDGSFNENSFQVSNPRINHREGQTLCNYFHISLKQFWVFLVKSLATKKPHAAGAAATLAQMAQANEARRLCWEAAQGRSGFGKHGKTRGVLAVPHVGKGKTVLVGHFPRTKMTYPSDLSYRLKQSIQLSWSYKHFCKSLVLSLCRFSSPVYVTCFFGNASEVLWRVSFSSKPSELVRA